MGEIPRQKFERFAEDLLRQYMKRKTFTGYSDTEYVYTKDEFSAFIYELSSKIHSYFDMYDREMNKLEKKNKALKELIKKK